MESKKSLNMYTISNSVFHNNTVNYALYNGHAVNMYHSSHHSEMTHEWSPKSHTSLNDATVVLNIKLLHKQTRQKKRIINPSDTLSIF